MIAKIIIILKGILKTLFAFVPVISIALADFWGLLLFFFDFVTGLPSYFIDYAYRIDGHIPGYDSGDDHIPGYYSDDDLTEEEYVGLSTGRHARYVKSESENAFKTVAFHRIDGKLFGHVDGEEPINLAKINENYKVLLFRGITYTLFFLAISCLTNESATSYEVVA